VLVSQTEVQVEVVEDHVMEEEKRMVLENLRVDLVNQVIGEVVEVLEHLLLLLLSHKRVIIY